MNLLKMLAKKSFSDQAIDIYRHSGIESLYPPQAEAISKGVLEGRNLLMSVPTAAGKTLIAELCMLKSCLEGQTKCLYIAPLKALASEKYHDFSKKFKPLGISVGLAIGDADSPIKKLEDNNIIIATAEKVDSLLRSKATWLINALSVVVLDEIHFINDVSRGPTMEILTARIKQLNPKVQFLALSATVQNADELAGWLDAELVKSTWRPIPLKEGVYFNNQIEFDKSSNKAIVEEGADDLNRLTLDTLRGQGQVLIFVNSRRSAQAVSRQIAASASKVLSPEEKNHLLVLSKKILGNGQDATKLCRRLAETVIHGSAFHHAGLKPRQRELIEENFKANRIKVISCTPTLAAGVNLPARRAVIRDLKRFERGLGQSYIPTSEYKQCAGRAGRPQYDKYGEAVMMAKTASESRTLFDRYIHAEPEPVTSKLSDEATLRIHVLASIAGGYVHDIKGMLEFISHTFLYYQNKSENLLDTIGNIFDFLYKEGFIDQSGYRFFATPFGSLTSRLYIDPMTSILIRNSLRTAKDRTLLPVGLLHILCCCPDGPLLNIGKKDMEELETFAQHFREDFIITSDNFSVLDDFYTYLSTLKTTWLLMQWIEEEKEDVICDQFNIGPGDVYRHVDSAQRLAYAAGAIAELFRQKSHTFQIDDIRRRLRYGVKEELLDIVNLKGIGRVRARLLYNKGYHNIDQLKKANPKDLAAMPLIGKKLSEDIFMQIQRMAAFTKFKSI